MYLFAYSLTSIATVLSCVAVLVLSQFAQEGAPYTTLPLLLITLLGVLFIAPLRTFYQGYEEKQGNKLNVLLPVIGLALAAIVAWGLSLITIPSPVLNTEGARTALQPTFSFVLAPIVALLGSQFLRIFADRTGSLIAAMVVYITCTLLANYTLDSFIPVPINEFISYLSGGRINDVFNGNFTGLVNVGTLFFGITFTQRDRVHQYGRKWAYIMIALAVVSNVLLASYLGTPFRYILVSFLAISVSEFMDTQIYHRLLQRNWWLRVGASNAVSIPLDTIIFTVFAFYGEVWATPTWMIQVIITDIIVKLLVGFIAAIRVVHNENDSAEPQNGISKESSTDPSPHLNNASLFNAV